MSNSSPSAHSCLHSHPWLWTLCSSGRLKHSREEAPKIHTSRSFSQLHHWALLVLFSGWLSLHSRTLIWITDPKARQWQDHSHSSVKTASTHPKPPKHWDYIYTVKYKGWQTLGGRLTPNYTSVFLSFADNLSQQCCIRSWLFCKLYLNEQVQIWKEETTTKWRLHRLSRVIKTNHLSNRSAPRPLRHTKHSLIWWALHGQTYSFLLPTSTRT